MAVLVAACANYSHLQDAETLPNGKMSVGVGLSFTRYDAEDTNDQGTEVVQSVSVPAVVVSARRGVTDHLEVQGTAWLPFGARVGAKYQLLGTPGQSGLQVSIGAHVGYLSLSLGSSDSTSSISFIDGYLPLYVGYRASPSFEVYAVPQYILRSVSRNDGSELGHVTGSSFGVAIGGKSKFLVEVGGFYDTLYEAPIVNTAIGIAL